MSFLSIPIPFRPTFSSPLDKRLTVATHSDLSSLPGKYSGMLVYVVDESKFYVHDNTVWNEFTVGSESTSLRLLENTGYTDLNDLENIVNPSTGDSYIVSGNLYSYSGTEWINAGNIQGPQGEPGIDGTGIALKGSRDSVGDLASIVDPQLGDAYLIEGDIHIYTEELTWVNAGNIQGPQGEPGLDGTDGEDGTDGTDGEDGKSAYEVALENSFVGTEEEWLDELYNTSFNGDRAITATVSGFTGVNPQASTIIEFLEKVFYPAVASTITNVSLTPSVIELGYSTSTNYTARINAHGYTIIGGTVSRNGTTVDTIAQINQNTSYTSTINGFITTGNISYAISAERSDGVILNNTVSRTAYDPFYIGTLSLAQVNSILSGVTRAGMSISGVTRLVESKATKTSNITTNNDRPVILYPASHGDLAEITDTTGFDMLDSFTKATFTYTRSDSSTVSYNIYYRSTDVSPVTINLTFKF